MGMTETSLNFYMSVLVKDCTMVYIDIMEICSDICG